MNPEHPVYIVSKGRYDSRLTSKALHALGVPHFMVVESQEFDLYAAQVDDSCTLLTLDPEYQRTYETCDDLGLSKSTGPGPARNFVWDHAVASGASWHWVMDDNIRRFGRLYHNRHLVTLDGTPLRVMEDFVARYTNVSMAGPNYWMFTPRKQARRVLVLNTRIYSCNLIRNDVPYRWRGRYNEDTDLSLRMLKDGWVTVQFTVFMQDKMRTQTVKGGNTADFYAVEGTAPKTEMLKRLHPDVTRVLWKFGRVHHEVDYKRFRQRPRLRPGYVRPEGVDNYGMVVSL